MKADPTKRIAVSRMPSAMVLITAHDVDRLGETDDALRKMCGASSDAVTELVPMTEQAVAEFCVRQGGRLLHGTLARYPYPRG